jgi:D-alanyl-lipoteichoic acid acyltransferase DltB (MBOAT superfamily)
MEPLAFLISGGDGTSLYLHGFVTIYILHLAETRNGKTKNYINLMITMLLGGLWHGANWTFVVWGGLHGFYLWVEKAIADYRKGVVNLIAVTPAVEVGALGGTVPEILKTNNLKNLGIAIFTFFLLNVTWVFFRSATFTKAWDLLKSMFGFAVKAEPMLTTLAIIKVSVIVIIMLISHWLMRNKKVLEVAYKIPWWLLGIIWSVLLLLLIWSQESSSSFIYFQF